MLSSVAPISGCSAFLSDHATFPDFISLPYKFILLVNFFQDDTRGATRKLLIITALSIFRVVKIPTLKMAKRLLLSGLQVALAEAVLWRWQAEQRHGPRRIAKHPELSVLLPLPACKVHSSELSLLCLNDLRVRGAEKDLAAVVGGLR